MAGGFPKCRDIKPGKKLPLPSSKLYAGYGPPQQVVAKLQKKAKDLGEHNAIRRNLYAHNARERLAAELDMLRERGSYSRRAGRGSDKSPRRSHEF